MHTLTIDDWRPTSLNRLLRMHWSRRSKEGEMARLLVLAACREADLPPATTRRRVSVLVECGGRGGIPDADNTIKQLLDALVWAKALRDDSPAWCELGTVEVRRGKEDQTTVTLEDIPCP